MKPGYGKHGHLGAANELFVAQDLLRRGYEVYRNVSPFGADLIARSGDHLFEVEVTAGQRSTNGNINFDKHKRRNWTWIAVVTDGSVRYYDKSFREIVPDETL